GQQLLKRERLRKVVVGPERQPRDYLVKLTRGGEHQDGRPRLLRAKSPADLVAVHPRQVAIEHHYVVLDQLDLAPRAFALVGDVDGHRSTAKPPGYRVREPSLILDDQDPHLKSKYAHARVAELRPHLETLRATPPDGSGWVTGA